nr:hypothetical protein CFP56_77739 [Quercus suber]
MEILTHLGFEEYINLILDNAGKVNIKRQSKKPLGKLSIAFPCIARYLYLPSHAQPFFTWQEPMASSLTLMEAFCQNPILVY